MEKLKYEDIKEGSILYEKWHEVKVLDKVDVDKSIHVMYVNQSGTIVVGSGNLSEEPLHCWNCQKDLIDNVRLHICTSCGRAVCTDSNCAKCHCGTTWEWKRINKN